MLMALMLLLVTGVAMASPEIVLGTPANYCVTYCYINFPFQVTNYDPAHRSGRIFCEIDAEVSTKLPVHAGEIKTKSLHASPIGVFYKKDGAAIGDVEMDTGVTQHFFMDAKVKSIQCHL